MSKSRSALVAALLTATVLAAPFEARATPSHALVVDPKHPAAADSNPGTDVLPLRSIQRAVNIATTLARSGTPVRVEVRDGVYREAVVFPEGSGKSTAPIVLEGAPGVVVSGADVWTGWRREPGTGYLVHEAARLPHSAVPPGWPEVPVLLRRRESVFVGGVQLRQALSRAELGELVGGGFAATSRGYVVRLPSGIRSSARIEVATRAQLLRLQNWRNVTVRGIRFEHTTSPIQVPAVQLTHCASITIDKVEVAWSNWAGLGAAYCDDLNVSRSSFDQNGAMGLSLFRTRRVSVVSVSNSNNNWRGAWAGFMGWENGMKVTGSRGLTIDGYTAVGNQSHGLWLDSDNRDVVVRNANVRHNARHGVFLEGNPGPISLRDSTVCGNGEGGIFEDGNASVTVVGNDIFRNRTGQLLLGVSKAPRAVTDWETRSSVRTLSERWTLRGNRIYGVDRSEPLIGSAPRAEQWALIGATFRGARNNWYNAASARTFALPGERVFGTLSDWRSAGGDDGTSRFIEPNPMPVCSGHHGGTRSRFAKP